ncbi:MAG: HD domain-containing phosphohydrolase, partial [Actinomycetota bacterium]
RTGALAIDVACELGLSAAEVRRCGLVGLLHDIGKLEIPDAVLQKPDRLTDDEFAVMRRHTELGGELMAATPVLADLAPAVRGHHERIDGRGYPDQLRAEDIPLVARVVSVCDSYDAMAFTRHYRMGMDHDRVRAILAEHRGAQWDTEVVDALLRVVERRSDRETWALDEVGRDESHDGPLGCDCLPEVATL